MRKERRTRKLPILSARNPASGGVKINRTWKMIIVIMIIMIMITLIMITMIMIRIIMIIMIMIRMIMIMMTIVHTGMTALMMAVSWMEMPKDFMWRLRKG